MSRVRLLFSEAWSSITANISTTFAATMTVLIGMFLLGLFIALGTWVLSWSDHVKKELQVKVYFATGRDRRAGGSRSDRQLQRRPAREDGRLRLEGERVRRQSRRSSPTLYKTPCRRTRCPTRGSSRR